MKFVELCKSFEMNKKVIISDNHRSLTGSEFMIEVQRAAKRLQLLGISDKRIVMLRMVNSIESVSVFFALLLSKTVVFVANPYDPIPKVCDTINDFAPFALLTDKPSVIAVSKHFDDDKCLLPQAIVDGHVYANIFNENNIDISNYDSRMKEADVAIFSSGATGEPKAILNNIDNLLLNAQMHAESIGLHETDTLGLILPLYYSYGLVANLMSCFVTNAHVDLHPQTGAVELQWLHEKEITALSLTPYFAKTLHENIPSLKILTLGGDVLHSKQALNLMSTFPDTNLFATYGLTEAGPRCTTWKFDKDILKGSLNAPIGKPLRGVTLSIHDDNKEESDHGELVVETPTRMLGYFFGTQKGFSMPDWANDKVYTGDLYNRRNGEMYFVARKKQVIVQGGEKLYPFAIESAIREVKGVLDVRVASISDKEKGNVAKAYIVAEKTLNIKTVRKSLLSHFTRSLIPEKLEFVDSISRTMAGKVA